MFARDIHGCRHSRVVGHAHIEKLVGTHAQDDESSRIEITKRAIDVTCNHPIKVTERAQRAVDELGGESGVAVRKMAVAPGLAQRLRQDDVRECALRGDLVKNLVGNATGFVGFTQLAVAVRVAPLTHR